VKVNRVGAQERNCPIVPERGGAWFLSNKFTGAILYLPEGPSLASNYCGIYSPRLFSVTDDFD
jgi:hypothetical protein